MATEMRDTSAFDAAAGGILDLESLAVGYDGRALIRDIELHVARGDVIALIGPNGAGKSTILKSVSAYLDPIAGVVRLGGDDLDGLPAKSRARRMSVVLTDHPRTELLTCLDIVEMGRYPYTGGFGQLDDEDKRIVEETMRLANVWEIRHRDFMQTSDGQRQRVLLARAICQSPDVIVLDEPTSYLDIRYQIELLGILRRHAKHKRIGVVMSLHELDMAQKVADYVLCVKGDRIMRAGTPEEIFTRDTIADLYDLEAGTYDPLFGSVEMARPEGEPRAFVVAGGGAGAAVFRDLQKRGIPFATGVLHQGDVDHALALSLATEIVEERAFEPIGDAAYARAKDAAARCGTVIVCDIEYGSMNERNRDLVEWARKEGLTVVEA